MTLAESLKKGVVTFLTKLLQLGYFTNPYPNISSYVSKQTVGVAPVTFTYPSGAKGLKFKVTHATQLVQVGEGESQTDSETNTALAISFDNADSVQYLGKAPDATHYTLIGSLAGTTIDISVI